MILRSPSPFARPKPGLRIVEGAPKLTRPTREEIASFPAESAKVVDGTWAAQLEDLERGRYNLRWMENKHFLLAGATGRGLGGAIATARPS